MFACTKSCAPKIIIYEGLIWTLFISARVLFEGSFILWVSLIYTEFDSYFQSIKHKISKLLEIKISHLKIKLQNTCKRCNNVEIMNVAIMDRNRYKHKCLNILNIPQFLKLYRGPTTSIEARFQRAVRNIKDHLSTKEHMRIY